jgi:hypothetical protein
MNSEFDQPWIYTLAVAKEFGLGWKNEFLKSTVKGHVLCTFFQNWTGVVQYNSSNYINNLVAKILFFSEGHTPGFDTLLLFENHKQQCCINSKHFVLFPISRNKNYMSGTNHECM